MTIATGLIPCPYCSPDKLYTPTGLKVHQKRDHQICPDCGCDLRAWPFSESHDCECKEEK